MAQSANPFDQFDAPANAGPQVLIPESGVVTEGREVDLNNSRLNGRRTEQQIRIDAENAARAAQAEARQRQALAANMYLKGLRLGANGQPEPIPGWVDPNGAKKPGANGALDALVGQIKETQRLFRAGPGSTRGIAGLTDLIPGGINGQFDAAANQLEDQAVAAFKVPGLGGQSDADAVRLAAANKPSRWSADGTNEQLFKGLRARVDAMRAAQGLPAAQWDAQAAAAQGQPVQAGQQTQPAMMVPGAGTTPPQTPQGPAGYDVGSVGAAPVSGSGGGGGNFASAAGVAMAKRLSQAYTKGARVQELNRMLADNGFQTFSDPGTIEAIQKGGRINFAPPAAADDRSALDRFIGDGSNNVVGAYGLAAADALTAGTFDNIVGGQTNLAQEYARQQYPGASLAGTVTGGALGAAGAEMGLARAGLGAGAAALGGDALYGAAYGAGSTEDGSRLLGAAGGGLGALAGGAAGRGIARGVGSVFRGVQNADAQLLRQNQIPVTVGQAMGGTAQRIENSMTSLPGVGDIVGNRYREGVAALRPAAVREAVGGVPNNITATGGREAVEQGRTAIGNAYDGALNGVDLNIDPGYKREVGSALQGASTLPGPLRDTFISTLQNRVAPQFNGQQIDGRGLQAAVQGLRKDSGDLIRRGEIQSDLFANRAGDVEEALFNLAERQAPGTQEALQAANRANRGMSIVEEASARALNNGGDFTAAQLGQAIKQNARRFNGVKAMNSGKIPLQALQEAAQRVLPSTVPDSGTTGRALVAGGLGLAGAGTVGGGAGYATDSGAGAGAGAGIGLAALLAAGGTKFGQRQAVKLLLDRPEMLIRAGNGIANRARIGGLFGAPMLAGAGASLATQ